MTQKTETNPKQIRVAILTPYLTESLQEMLNVAPDPLWAIAQVVDFGYNPNDNLSGTNRIITTRFSVELTNPKGDDGDFRSVDSSLFYERLLDSKSVLAIAGSTEETEEVIREKRNFGLVVARYSIFYGGPSRYTGRSAAESGYALDVPKDVLAVKKMLSHDSLLESLAERNEGGIMKSIETLNQDLARPILITPFLHETLQNKRNGGFSE